MPGDPPGLGAAATAAGALRGSTIGEYRDVPVLGRARTATGAAYGLGEGAAWDPVRDQVLWVDIDAGAVLQGTLAPEGGIDLLQATVVPDARTAAAVAVSATGDKVVAGRDRLYAWSPLRGFRKGPVLASGAGRRLNDGKPDPAGRFVVGTLTEPGPSHHERLLRIDDDGRATVLDDDLTLANGLGWSPHGDRMYSVDSLVGRVYVRDYEPASGDVGRRITFATVDPSAGLPDGMAVDASGHVWLAMWGGGCVLRLDHDGQVSGVVPIPAPNVTSIAFAGSDLATLVVTSARKGMSASELERYPAAGHLFTVDLDVAGCQPYLWNGRL